MIYHGLFQPLAAAALWALEEGYPRFVRYPLLQCIGYRVANPYWSSWWRLPSARMSEALDEVLSKIQNPRFEVVLELGCHEGRRITPILKRRAREVWGVDLIEGSRITNVDRYFQFDFPDACDAFAEVADGAVDAVFVVNFTGFHPTTTWRAYFDGANTRLAPFMAACNFPRLMHSGSHLIVLEWESAPEIRFGRQSLASVQTHAQAAYDPPALEGYARVVCGFSRCYLGPFVVYRRL